MQEEIDDIKLQEQRTLLHDRGICVVIPTYNNGGTVADVVNRTLLQCDDVIVVNDGSDDDTASILSSINRITIVTLTRNSGKGYALKAGFSKAKEMGFAYAVTIDSDGQHYPEDISCLLRANIENPGAIIVGQRKDLESQERSSGSKFANSFSNFWFCVQTWHYLRDTQTGFRLYPLNNIHGLSFLTSRYEAELELLVFSSWHGVKIISQPVRVYYPPREERVSHFRPAKDFSRIFVLNTILCILGLIYALPKNTILFLLNILRSVYMSLIVLVISLFIFVPSSILIPLFHRDRWSTLSRLHNILYHTTRTILRLHLIPGMRFTLSNPDKEDFSRPSVLICNHQSSFDLLVLLAINKKTVVLTNDKAWHSPLFGSIIRKAEFYPISQGIDNIIPRLRELSSQGYSIAIYPEGTRSVDGAILRFHKGAFHIARELKLDIVPLVLYGAGRVFPKNSLHVNRGHIHLTVLPRVTVEAQESIGTELQTASHFRKLYIKTYRDICNQYDKTI